VLVTVSRSAYDTGHRDPLPVIGHSARDTAVMLVRPFSIAVSPVLLEDLRGRLARLRWPSEATLAVLADVSAGPPGLPVDWLRRLMERWRDGFDWSTQQAKLNRLPQVQVELGGQLVHAIHLHGRGPSPVALLCHGWPSSFAEFTEVVPHLTDSLAFGATQAMPLAWWCRRCPALCSQLRCPPATAAMWSTCSPT
jgi:hypothetical protein